MTKPQKFRQNALDPIRTLVQIAAELETQLPTNDSEIDEAILTKVTTLALRFPAFQNLGVRRDTFAGRHMIYHLCAWLLAAIRGIAHMNYVPEHQRMPVPIIQSEPRILQGGRLVLQFGGMAAPFYRTVAKIFLDARNLDRLRICERCEKVFYAPRKRSYCCSPKCTNALRQARFRRRAVRKKLS